MAFSLRDYDILGEIGRGGFGTVLRARQKSLDRVVAIKCLSPQRVQDRRDIVRFRREARAMATLAHDNIVSVFDYGFHSGNYYIVMEYVDGLTLDEALVRGMGVDSLLLVLEKTAAALEYAHGEGVIHRDVKPGNILLGRNGQVRLADFGLASFRQDMTPQSASAALGTLCYMAPEAMVTPKEVDPQADAFSLGCVLYQVLSGNLPFPGGSIGEVSYKVLNELPQPVETDERRRSLAELAIKCLDKDREARPFVREIHRSIGSAIRDRSHVAEEELVSFVRGERQGTPGNRITSGPAVSSRTLRRRSRATLVIAALLALAAVALVPIIRRTMALRREARTCLPGLPGKDKGDDLSLPARSAHGTGADPVATDGPAPLSGTRVAVNAGTLVLHGIVRTDTVTINGAPVAASARSTRKISVPSGHYRLEVRRADGSLLTREVDIMPYQIVEWNPGRRGK